MHRSSDSSEAARRIGLAGDFMMPSLMQRGMGRFARADLQSLRRIVVERIKEPEDAGALAIVHGAAKALEEFQRVLLLLLVQLPIVILVEDLLCHPAVEDAVWIGSGASA